MFPAPSPPAPSPGTALALPIGASARPANGFAGSTGDKLAEFPGKSESSPHLAQGFSGALALSLHQIARVQGSPSGTGTTLETSAQSVGPKAEPSHSPGFVPDSAPSGNSLPQPGMILPSLRAASGGTEIPHATDSAITLQPAQDTAAASADDGAAQPVFDQTGIDEAVSQPPEDQAAEELAVDQSTSVEAEPLATAPIAPATVPQPPAVAAEIAASAVSSPVTARASDLSARVNATGTASRSVAPGPVPASAAGLSALVGSGAERPALLDEAGGNVAVAASPPASNSVPDATPLSQTPIAPGISTLAAAPSATAPANTNAMQPIATATIEQVIEQVAEAREAGRSLRPEMTVRHSEFGAIAMRLEPLAAGWRGHADWRVTLSARDPGFIPAIQTALGERAVAATSEGAATQNGTSQRGHDHQSQSFAHNSQGGFGSAHSGGEPRYGYSPGSGQGNGKPYMGEEGDGGSTGTVTDQADAKDALATNARDGSLFA